MMNLATYLYGFVREGTPLGPGLAAIEPDADVRVVAVAGLAAVVSEVAPGPFESCATDPEWLIPRAMRHERVVEAMRAGGPILPVRFGALFTTPAALEGWAALNRGAIDDFLGRTAGKDEWTVRLTLDPGSALESLAAADPDWAARRSALPDSPGARYLREKRLREEARQEARRRALAVAARLRAAASRVAEERLLPPRAPASAGIEPILHAAYLVPRDSAAGFHETTRAAAAALPCLGVQCAGPWAPSHFCPAMDAPHS